MDTVSSFDSWNSNSWFDTFLLLPIPAIADPILLVSVAIAIAAVCDPRRSPDSTRVDASDEWSDFVVSVECGGALGSCRRLS